MPSVIVSEGCMKAVKIPTGFAPKDQARGQIGVNWQLRFQASNRPEVVLTLHYRGQPLNPEESKKFRTALSASTRVLFNPHENVADTETLASLSETMGNAGDNQLVNFETGYRGPCFSLEKAEIQELNNRRILVVNGRFKDEHENLTNVYRGIFIDANPGEPKCRVEEVFLHAPNERLFAQYLPLFRQTIESIEWL